MKTLIASIVAVLFIAGCGGEDYSEAIDKCEQKIATECAIAEQCYGYDFDSCYSQTFFCQCARSVDVDMFDLCMQGMAATTCDQVDRYWEWIPGACEYAIIRETYCP